MFASIKVQKQAELEVQGEKFNSIVDKRINRLHNMKPERSFTERFGRNAEESPAQAEVALQQQIDLLDYQIDKMHTSMLDTRNTIARRKEYPAMASTCRSLPPSYSTVKQRKEP